MKKIAVAIDGANLYATAKMLRMEVDFLKLKEWFGPELVRAYYYTAVKPRSDELDNLVPLLDWLEYNGYKLVKKETKTYIDADGRPKIKGNMDMEIAVDAMEISSLPGNITDFWLFSGDGDFTYLVAALQRRGVRVVVCSSIETVGRDGQKMSVCSDELRRTADSFVDLAKCKDIFSKVERVGSKYV